MRKYSKFILIIFLLIAFMAILSKNERVLGGGYHYLTRDEAIDIGSRGAIVYKSPDIYSFQDIKISGDVVRIAHNSEFIIAIQKKPVSLEIEQEPFEYNKELSLNYFIIVKKTDSVYGPYTEEEYREKREKLRIPKYLRLKKVKTTKNPE